MKKTKLQTMTRLAITVALLVLLDIFETVLLRMPQGGSISVASLVFLFVLPLFSVKEATVLFFSWRVLRLVLMPPFYVGILQLILDYFVAYSGFLFVYPLSKRGGRRQLTCAIVIANAIRYCIHVLTGTLYFGAYAGTQPVLVYSLIYNLSYMGPTLVVQLVLANVLLPVLNKMKRRLG